MKASQSHKKSSANRRSRPLEFEMGDQVLLKVSLTKGITRSGMAGKLSQRYIGSYHIAYRLELPLELPRVQNIFYVSQLCKYILDPSNVNESDPVQL